MARSTLAPARVLRAGGPRRPDVPARRIPLVLRWAVRLSSLGAQTAWLLTAIAVLLSLRVIPKIRMHPPRYDSVASGIILARTFDVVTYEFFDESGVPHRQESTFRHPNPAEVGDRINIWYDAYDPDESAVYAKEPYDFGPGSLALLAVPGGALVMALLCMWQRRRIRLLRYGREVAALAKLADASGGRTANLSFKFDIEGTAHTTHLTTVRSPDQLGTTETVLYDPNDPEYAIAIADLPGRPTLTAGRFALTQIPFGVFVLPIAALTLIGVLVAKSV